MNDFFLKKTANELRLKILDMAVKKSKGHIGGTFSCLDILVYLYYSKFLNITKNNISKHNRDRLILSKGHACLALYLIFENLGFMSKEKLDSYGENNGLGAQLDINIPGVDWNTGSLGHAIGVMSGFSIGNKKNKYIAIVGDAEMDEGSIWEALVFAGENKLSNVIVVVDRNRLSVTEKLDDVGIYRNFMKIIASLGWNGYEINGHDFHEIDSTFKKIRANKKPSIILANTIKGKGVSFMENSISWHHGIPNEYEYKIARNDLLRGFE